MDAMNKTLITIGVIAAFLLWRQSKKATKSAKETVRQPVTINLPMKPVDTVNLNTAWKVPEKGKQYMTLFERYGKQYGVPPLLLAKVAQTESAYNPRAVSPAGAQGLMQIMPLHKVDAFDPETAVKFAAEYLAQNFKKFGRWKWALAAYNAGPGTLKKYLEGVRKTLPIETQNYMAKILKDVPVDYV